MSINEKSFLSSITRKLIQEQSQSLCIDILRFYHCNLKLKEQSEASCFSSEVELSLPESTLYHENGTVVFPVMPIFADGQV